MKKLAMIAGAMLLAGAATAHGQYYQAINQASSMIQRAVIGGANYRGFVDVSYMGGIGSKRADFLEFTTTQGLKYNNWFYMGLGAGVDIMWSTVNDGNTYRDTYRQSAVMIPLYTDFRFNLGSSTSTAFFIDARVGAAFWTGNKYILVGDSYINSSESFYLKPTIGVRLPLGDTGKYAINAGVSYQLLTNSYWYNPNNSRQITLSSFGATIGFEW